MLTTYKFSVIIANFNGEKYLNDCLASVFKTSYPRFEVIIIEDGSTDRSLEIIKKFQYKYKLQLVQNETNLGLVASRNKALKKATGDILVFLDNDTKVDKDWLKGLAKVFSEDSTVGAAQCKIFDFKQQSIIQEIGMKLIPYTGLGTPLGRGEKDRGQFEKPQEIIALGAGVAVRKAVALKIGGFDQKLFHYTDDLDFSWRIWILGWRVVLAPTAKIYHYTKIHVPTYNMYFHLSKNSIRMIIKNYDLGNVMVFLPLSIAFNIIGGLAAFVRTRKIKIFLGVCSGLGWNIIFLSDTLRARYKVQRLRKKGDKDIFSRVMIVPNLLKTYKLYNQTSKLTTGLIDRRLS